MKNAEIRIIRAELENWPNKTTGEVREMTKIYYAIKMADNDNVLGYSILKCYKQGNLLPILTQYIMAKCVADIEERPTENGSKYVLMKLNGKELRA